MKRTHWIARCAYPGRENFLFYSPDFVVEHWSDLERTAQQTVADAWAKISPHAPPAIVELIPGYMGYVGGEK